MKYSKWVEQREDSESKGAGICFTDGKQILLLQRNGPPVPGCWGLPGGHLKKGEDTLAGAKREAKEECGSDEGEIFAKTAKTNNSGFHFTTYFSAVDKPFDCLIDHEHSDFKWFDLDKLRSVQLLDSLEESIEQYLKIIQNHFFIEKE